MNNLYDILNIKKSDIEKSIQVAIDKTKKELNGLTKEQTCFIYTSYLYQNLRKNNIACYIVDTMEDLNRAYQHRFIVVPKNEKSSYVLDLTVSQFGSSCVFKEMEDKGYQLLDNDKYDLYVSYVSVNYDRNKRKF